MKGKFLLKSVILLVVFLNGCSQKPSDENSYIPKTSVEVIFFHTNYRCTTCEAIKSESKKIIEQEYGNKVRFLTYDLYERKTRKIAKSLGVHSQMLLIISSQNKIEITVDGFLYAHSNPEKYKQVLVEKINSLLP